MKDSDLSINERIRKISEIFYNGNITSMAKSTLISRTTINSVIGEKQVSPGYDVIRRILEAPPLNDISSDWLIFGNGPMLRTDQALPEINYEYKGAPYYNVDFTGGFDLVPNDQTMNPDYYINYQPYNKPGVMWCNVTGHSMEPEINHGDTIAIKELSDWRIYLPFGEIYGIVTTEHRTIKRVAKAENEGFIKLIPTNKSPEYSPQEIPLQIIQKVFLVLGNVKRFQ